MRILVLLIFILFSPFSQAQILNKLKNKIKDKVQSEVRDAKYEAKVKARNAARNELEEVKANFDSTDIDYAILLSDNSGLFGSQDKSGFGAKFLRLGGIANSLYKDFDLDDEENATMNLQMGQSAYAMGKYVFAEKRFISAEKYFEKLSQTDDLNYMKTIASRGLLYTTTGRYQLAEEYTSKALVLRKDNLGETNMAVAASLNNYAVLNYNLGRYNESEKEFESAIAVIKANNLQEAMPYAIVLNNKAILYQSIGNYEAALKLMQDAMQLSGGIETVKAKNQLKFLSNLALLYQQMGKYDEAEKMYLELYKKLEKGKPEEANLLNNYAILSLLMNKEDRVESMLQQAAEIYKSSFGESSPAYAKVISDLGNFYRYKTKYAAALPLLQQALQIREEVLGTNHPLFVQSQEDMAILYWKNKELNKAVSLYRTVMDKTLDFINRYFAPMSEAEKTRYWDILSPRFQRFYNFALEAGEPDKSVIKDMLEYRIATKGILLSSSKKISESIINSGNEQMIDDFINWIDHKEQLTRLYAYSKQDLQEQSVNIDSLESIVNNMEKKLSQVSNDFADFYFTSKPDYLAIQSQLNPGEALIEIIRLQKFDQVLNEDCRYAGLIVTNEKPEPIIVIIKNGSELEEKYAKAYRIKMKNKINDIQSYINYWEPFEKELGGIKTIYVSLDGVYNQVNLNTLKKSVNDYLINKYDFILLSNPRDILVMKKDRNDVKEKKAVLIGFPDFGGGAIAPLPGTKKEVDGINAHLRTSGYEVAELIQKDATETNLKLSRQVSILHIATHGYFLKDVVKSNWPIGVHTDYAKDNVLLRSGLMLAGASNADKMVPGLDNNNNGIITSYEAMNLDLRGTDLVVLSACETGLGEVKAGEGVYGLQRSFLVAGADAIIMSLWKVDDAATQELMNNFYTNLVNGENKQLAFRNAQKQLMTKFKEPLYWGAFVMMNN